MLYFLLLPAFLRETRLPYRCVELFNDSSSADTSLDLHALHELDAALLKRMEMYYL
jgi:hypothetical protein